VADGVVADPEAAEVVFVAEAVKDSRIELKEPLGGLKWSSQLAIA
jgi:hypothetical protein